MSLPALNVRTTLKREITRKPSTSVPRVDASKVRSAPEVAPPSSEAPSIDERHGRLVGWRFDVGGDAYALLELPAASVAATVLARLTPAEREVARLIAAGLSNADIARRRGVSPRTVANQAASTFRKLGVTSRLGLYALNAGGVLPHHADDRT